VSRGLRSPAGVVVIEGVDLANRSSAVADADALTSKLQRLTRDERGDEVPYPVIMLVAYRASPTGLNGEGYMKTWIEEAAKAKTFDIVTEANEFHAAVADALAAHKQQPQLIPQLG